MNFQNTVLAATVGLLTCPEECLDDALARCDKLFDSTALYGTGKPSVAVRSASAITPLRDWVMQNRARGPLACWASVGEEDDGGADAHMMAGFPGGRPSSLYLRHAGGRCRYSAGTISSAPHAMTVAQFTDLIDAQANPDFYYQKILTDINAFHSCNGMADVAPDELAGFLQSDAGAHAWNIMGNQIMREIQVEALTVGESFVIPSHLANLLEKVLPFHERIRHVWLDAYDEDQVTGSQLYQLIIAQPFHAEIWRQCADPEQLAARLGDDFDLTEFPCIDEAQWGHYLQALDAIEAELVRDDLLELLRLECRQRDCEPHIPAHLEKIFGPGEEERRRLSYRASLQHDTGWRLICNPVRWCMYVFDEEERDVDAGDDDADGTFNVDHLRHFEAALEAIEAFVLQIESPFAVHFSIAKRLAAQARGDGPFDRTEFARIVLSNGVPDDVVREELIDLFAAFGWRSRRVMGLAAIAAADVFGAMGSWNDQYFDDEQDDQFEAVSSALFCAMNRYIASLLDVSLPEGAAFQTPAQSLFRRMRQLLPRMG